MRILLLTISLLLTLSLASTLNDQELRSLWSAWKSIHTKSYASGEDEARFAIFVENHKKVLKFNAQSDNVKLGLNKFADLTPTEFKMKYAMCGFKEENQDLIAQNIKPFDQDAAHDTPTSIDWRRKGVVTYIKDQGQCGSCWAFSATGVLEGLYAIKTGKLLEFSEQQIVSCDSADQGCNGGWPYLALEYAAKSGIDQESNYPYKAVDAKCKFNAWSAIKVNTGYQFVTPNSTEALKAAIAQQPVSVAIEADQDIFQLYNSGVIGSGCGANLDHAVLAVGYDKGFFIVKNSWGPSWGEQGYVFLSDDARMNNGQGACGILGQPVIAI